MFSSSKRRGTARDMSAKSRGQQAIKSAIEALETRTLMSTVTYNVLTNSDSVAAIVTPSGLNAYNANTLRAAINSANNQSFPAVIQFKEDATHFTGGANNTITLTSGLTLGPISPAGTHTYKIVGPTAKPITVSGANLCTDFTTATGISAEFDTLTIAHGNATGGDGGGINANGPLTLTGDTFASNHSTSEGGAVDSYSGVITVTNTNFIGNSATSYGGAVYIDGSSTSAAPKFTGDTFSSNATGYGGAIYNDAYNPSSFTVSGSTFNANTAATDGGAIYLYGDGGTVTASITTSKFTGDSAAGDGGAIYSDDGKSLTITSDTFSTDKSTNDNGGAVYSSDKTLTVGSSSFTGDTSYSDGGAVYFDGNGTTPTLTVTASTFSNDSSLHDYGGAIFNYANGTVANISGSSFTGDSAYEGGGAIYSETDSSASLTLTNDNISNDTAGNSYGGGVYSHDGTLIISGSTFANDKATDSEGGAVYEGNASTVTITNSSFTGDVSYYEGGALYLDNSSAIATVTSDTFTNDSNNTADEGGAIYSFSSTLTVTNSTFIGDSGGYGGGIYSDDVTLTVTNDKFTNDSATYDGGDIDISYDTTATITGSTFTGGTAEYGGGIYSSFTNSSSPDINRSLNIANDTFTGESVDNSGGAIYYYFNNNNSANSTTGTGLLEITQTTFDGNTAATASSTDGGGAVYASNADTGDLVNVFDSTFKNNVASSQSGGGLYLNSDSAQVANDTFYGNSAGTYGGGIYANPISATSTTTITDSTLSGNTASFAGGGGIYASTAGGGDVILDGDIVAGNYVTGTPSTYTDLAGTFDPTSTDDLIGDGSGQTGFTAGNVGGNFVGTDFAPINPLLGPLANNGGPTQTMVPASNSLAIGNNSDFPVTDSNGNDVTQTDQRGVTRPQDQGYDIGAVQTGATPVVVVPALTLHAASVTAPGTGSTTINFTVTLSSPATAAFSVTYSTVGQSASSQNGDYMGFTNRVSATFPIGTTSFTLPVTIVKRVAGHGSYPKQFQMKLVSVNPGSAATIAVATAEGTIN